MTKLFSLIPVWMTLMFTQGHRVMGNLEFVQSFCSVSQPCQGEVCVSQSVNHVKREWTCHLNVCGCLVVQTITKLTQTLLLPCAVVAVCLVGFHVSQLLSFLTTSFYCSYFLVQPILVSACCLCVCIPYCVSVFPYLSVNKKRISTRQLKWLAWC